MSIPRLHLLEFEDQNWFPTVLRDLATDYLCFIQATFCLHRAVVPILAGILRKTGHRQIIDLCSGGAGPLLEIQKALAATGLDTGIIMTDRFPNLGAFQRIEQASREQISFVSENVDARRVPNQLRGLRTIFNSFHHFRRSDALRILRNAVESAQPIAIFEYPERAIVIVLLTMVLTPFLVALATPFIRPFRWQRLLLTYLLPLIPLTCWWDGIVSQLRAYTVAELKAMAKESHASLYEWHTGTVSLLGSLGHLTYLVGHPTKATSLGPETRSICCIS
jgi:hypothetical protein